MILFQSGLIKLDYDPATDILSVDMPSINYNLAAEFRRALDIIVENVRNYDVKKLLVDARKSVVEMETEDYAALVAGFTSDLKNTRLQKGARIVSDNRLRENIVQKVIEDAQPVSLYQTFTAKADALAWLKGND